MPFNFVFDAEPQPYVNWFALRCGIQFHTRDFLCVEMVYSFQEQGRPDALPAPLRVHQDHADPRETALIDDGGHRTRHLSVPFRDETSFSIGLKESFPIILRLVPSCNVLQAHSGREVGRGHRSDMRVHAAKQLCLS